jgi:hypothetical protein
MARIHDPEEDDPIVGSDSGAGTPRSACFPPVLLPVARELLPDSDPALGHLLSPPSLADEDDSDDDDMPELEATEGEGGDAGAH